MRRSTALELMDQPELVSREAMVGALDGLRRVNRVLGGQRVLLEALRPLLAKAQRNETNTIRICDIGTGAADLPIVVAKEARRLGVSLQITAVEMNPDLCSAAKTSCRKFPEIQTVCADAREVLCESFDIVTASLFLHHFPPDEAKKWLALMDRSAQVGWIVNDLERHWLAWAGIRLIGPLLSTNAVFLNDGPLSVRRSYTAREWLQLARDAGAGGARLRRRWPWRIVLGRF